ncbi:MAG: hypothetical protein HY520_04685 [Candidatus Aenigmarchaeota archaeon]|nr:hypothetical protein [Candidatus Aenigmarchaeota archaeon]
MRDVRYSNLFMEEAVDSLRAQAERIGYKGAFSADAGVLLFCGGPQNGRVTVADEHGDPDPRFRPVRCFDLPEGYDLAHNVSGVLLLRRRGWDPKAGGYEPPWDCLPDKLRDPFGTVFSREYLRDLYSKRWAAAMEEAFAMDVQPSA